MPSSSHADAKFRSDITGLRTIAILAVVLVHAGVSWFPGGFVGVDVFFVISGFLITAHLLGEVETSGRVALFAFWARKLRRLFPALVAVTTAACILSPLVLLPLELQKLTSESAQRCCRSRISFLLSRLAAMGSKAERAPKDLHHRLTRGRRSTSQWHELSAS